MTFARDLIDPYYRRLSLWQTAKLLILNVNTEYVSSYCSIGLLRWYDVGLGF